MEAFWPPECQRDESVLKISLVSSASGIIFKLEGKLAGAWVSEVERSWYQATTNGEHSRITVDLSGVTFVNAEGRELLAWMHRRGAALKASDYTMKCLVDQIERNTQEQAGPRRL